jgi:hypothetical protein
MTPEPKLAEPRAITFPQEATLDWWRDFAPERQAEQPEDVEEEVRLAFLHETA